ncbi:TRAP transporter permease [Algihabitans sp.]|uniref:TRAP transporter permease n=1 Tax=Algihabitans sp. TaxID=2821514 RepID=UPI003BA8BCD4
MIAQRSWLRILTLALMAGMILFHFDVVLFGAPQPFTFRGTHLVLALVLVFLLFPQVERRSSLAVGLDILFIAASLVTVGYLILNQEALYQRFQFVTPPAVEQFWLGWGLIFLVLEGCRRTLGPALPLTALAFVGYALVTGLLTAGYIVDVNYLTTEGIFGIPLNVSATFLFLFVLFGALAERLGTGRFFIEFSTAVAGRTTGGPAKVASLSSAFFGSISGSAVANIMTTGSYTIPLMKRLGYNRAFAGSVEAVASTGGQIMPPVMGAAAFVMAEIMGVSYLNVMLIALIPATLFFVSVFVAIHFEAKRQGLSGLPESQIPEVWRVLRERGHQIIPLIVIMGTLFAGFSPAYAALYGILSILPTTLLRKQTRSEFSFALLLEGLENGVRNAIQVAMACACAGIVVGVIVHSGLGLEFSSFIRGISQDSMLVALILTALAGIVIGMGLPTTPAYILQTALLIPALVRLGTPLEAAHLFALYYAIMSTITPPVAIGLFAANSISGAKLWESSVAAAKLGMTGYIVPFMFVYSPALIMQGSFGEILFASLSAIAGVIFLSAGLHAYLTRHLRMLERCLLVAAAFLLIYQGLLTDVVGLALAFVAFFLQRRNPVAKVAATLDQ